MNGSFIKREKSVICAIFLSNYSPQMTAKRRAFLIKKEGHIWIKDLKKLFWHVQGMLLMFAIHLTAMFFIRRTSTNEDWGEALAMRCDHCNKVCFFRLQRVRQWLSFFLIPVIPYGSQYFLECPFCKYGWELFASASFKKFKRICGHSKAYLTNKIDSITYQKKVALERPSDSGGNKED